MPPERTPHPRNVGFIGTGELTSAVVRALRARSDDSTIRLSPRSDSLSTALANEYANVVRESSNADVVRNSQVVVLAVRPQQLTEALAGVEFNTAHVVISFVATVPAAHIAKLVAPATRVCRVTPLAMVASRRGPIVMAPALPEAEALFAGLGELVAAESEDQMMAFGSAAALLSSFFQLQQAIASWLIAGSVSPENASLYVRSMFAAASAIGLEEPSQTLSDLSSAHETPGGLNDHARKRLRANGWFDEVDCTLCELRALSLSRLPPKK